MNYLVCDLRCSSSQLYWWHCHCVREDLNKDYSEDLLLCLPVKGNIDPAPGMFSFFICEHNQLTFLVFVMSQVMSFSLWTDILYLSTLIEMLQAKLSKLTNITFIRHHASWPAVPIFCCWKLGLCSTIWHNFLRAEVLLHENVCQVFARHYHILFHDISPISFYKKGKKIKKTLNLQVPVDKNWCKSRKLFLYS